MKNTAHSISDIVNPTRIETDFGERKVSDQNFSKIIALPKGALINCRNPIKVQVKLVYEDGLTYIKLVPIQFRESEI